MNDDRVTKIEAILNESFSPTQLLVKDQSHLHAGHAGARDGRGHYEVQIVSGAFAGLRPLARHRLVYDALGTLMETDIHAVQIRAKALDEA